MKIDSKVILFFWQICNNTVYLFFFAWLLHCPLIKKNKKPGDVHKTHPPGFNKSDENRNRKMLFPVKKLHKRMKRFFSDNNACGRRTNMVYYLYVGAGVPVGSYVSQHIIYQAMLSSQLNKSAGVFFSPPAGEQYLLFLYCSTYECPCQELLKKKIYRRCEKDKYILITGWKYAILFLPQKRLRRCVVCAPEFGREGCQPFALRCGVFFYPFGKLTPMEKGTS